MPGNDDYEIRARIVVDDRTGPGVARVDRQMDRLEARGASAGSFISSALGRGFAVLGSGAIFGGAIRGITSLHGKTQNAVGAIGTAFSVFEKMPIEAAMRAAQTEVKNLSRDAATGVGELDNYVDTFGKLVGANTGKSRDELRALTKQALTAGFAMRGQAGLEQAPLDIVQALGQGVNDKMTPFAIAAVQAAGMTAEAFNKLDKGAKVDVLMRGFAAFEDGAAVLGKTWDARWATLKDNVANVVRMTTSKLFDRWSDQLASVNDWFTKNEKVIERLADEWAPKLAAGWDHLIEKAGTYAAIVGGLGVASAMPELPSFGGAGGGGAAAATSKAGEIKRIGLEMLPEIFGKRRGRRGIERGAVSQFVDDAEAALGRGMKRLAARFDGPSGPSFWARAEGVRRRMPGGAGGLPAIFGARGEAGGGGPSRIAGAMALVDRFASLKVFAAGGPLAMLGGSLASAAAAAAPVVAVLGVVTLGAFAVKGAFEEYPGLFALIQTQSEVLVGSLGRLVDALGGLNESGSALNKVGAVIGGAFLMGILALEYAIDATTKTITAVGHALVFLGGSLEAILGLALQFEGLRSANAGLVATGGAMFARGGETAGRGLKGLGGDAAGVIPGKTFNLAEFQAGEQRKASLERNATLLERLKKRYEKPAGTEDRQTGGGNTNINGPITIQVQAEINADPARVGMAMGEWLGKVRRHPRAARRTAVPTQG